VNNAIDQSRVFGDGLNLGHGQSKSVNNFLKKVLDIGGINFVLVSDCE
jgi:hypothetical protein